MLIIHLYYHSIFPDGIVGGRIPNPAIPLHVLAEISGWMRAEVSMDDVVDQLRVRTIPTGYTPHPWTPGKLLRAHLHIMYRHTHIFSTCTVLCTCTELPSLTLYMYSTLVKVAELTDEMMSMSVSKS